MHFRSALIIAATAGSILVSGCADQTNESEELRSAPRMLFHNPLGELIGSLRAPARMDYTATTFYVADPKLKAVVAFDRTTLLETLFPLSEAPLGIANDGIGSFYVSLVDGTVAIYDGTFAAPTGALSDPAAVFVHPTDLMIDPTGLIYVVDTGADAVFVFNSNGTYNSTIGARGNGPGEFKAPSSIAYDTLNDRVVVADQDNHRIQVFDNAGGFLYAFGYRVKYVGVGTTAESWFARTSGLAVDAGGFIYVVDGLLGKVRIYDQTGGELGEVLGHEDHFGGLVNPGDVAIDPATLMVMVVNSGVGQIQLYEEEPPGDLKSVISTSFSGGNPEIGSQVRGWDAPHMESDLSCARCHDFDDSPGGHLGLAEGQANLCFSCHTAAGQAPEHLWSPDGSDSHAWAVPVINSGARTEAPDEDSLLAPHLDGGNVKCATCHDQHNDDVAQPFLRMPIIGDSALCAECHLQFAEWTNAGHSDADSQAFTYPTGPGRESCAQCHTGFGFIDFAAGVPTPEQRTDPQVVTCWVCHQTHGTANPTLARIYDEVELPGGIVVTDAEESALCMACHNGRRAPDDGSLTPHYALGAATLVGVNGNEFGYNIPNSAHTGLVLCKDCHMAPSPAEGMPGAGKVGGHSFNIVWHQEGDPDDGFENVENACTACHTGLATVNRTAGGDYDGNGAVEGVQDEIQGLLDIVLPTIEATGAVFLGHYPYWNLDGVDPLEVDLVEDAIWNYEYIDNDGSLGVHNTGYSAGLLQATYFELTGGDVPGAALRYFP